MRKEIAVFFLVFTCCLVNAQPASQKMIQADKNPIKVGVIYNLTGRESPLGQSSSRGSQLAAHAINEAGGIDGRPIQLIEKDGKSDSQTILDIAKAFAKNPDISVVIGLNATEFVRVAAPIIAAAHKIFISSGATDYWLTKIVPKYLFLTCFSNNVQAAAAAEYTNEYLGLSRGVILYESDTRYGQTLNIYFIERFGELEGEVLLSLPVSHNDYNVTEQIKNIRSMPIKPQFIYLALGPTAGPRIIRALRKAGLNMPIIGADSLTANELIKVAGKHANNVSFTTHGVVDPVFSNVLPALMRQYLATQRFDKLYKNMHHHLPRSVYTALGYDTVNLIVAAIDQAGSTSPKKIIETLHVLDPFIGVTGKISYINHQNVPIKTVSIIRVEHSKAVFMGNWIPIKVPHLILTPQHKTRKK